STITSDVSLDKPDCAPSRMRRVMLTRSSVALRGHVGRNDLAEPIVVVVIAMIVAVVAVVVVVVALVVVVVRQAEDRRREAIFVERAVVLLGSQAPARERARELRREVAAGAGEGKPALRDRGIVRVGLGAVAIDQATELARRLTLALACDPHDRLVVGREP